MAGGRRSKAKGDAFEREVRDLHREHGIEADRVPLSGAAGGIFSGDLFIRPKGGDILVAECKKRKDGSGFRTIERWLEGAQLLFLRRNRAAPMVVMDARLWLATAQRAYGADTEVIEQYIESRKEKP